jgi:hypothetical protein
MLTDERLIELTVRADSIASTKIGNAECRAAAIHVILSYLIVQEERKLSKTQLNG